MPYCPECGSELEGTHSFCPSCGSDLQSHDSDVEASETATHPQTSASIPDRFMTGQKILLVGAAVAAVGAFLPWLRGEILGTVVSMNGIEGDGVFTLILALLAGGVAVVRWGKIARISVALLGIVVLLFGLLYISDPLLGAEFSTSQSEQIARQAISPAIGLYLTAAGGLAILVGPVIDYAQ